MNESIFIWDKESMGDIILCNNTDCLHNKFYQVPGKKGIAGQYCSIKPEIMKQECRIACCMSDSYDDEELGNNAEPIKNYPDDDYSKER